MITRLNEISSLEGGIGTVVLCATTARESLVINQPIHITGGNFVSVTIGCEGQTSSDSVEPGCAINKTLNGGFVVGNRPAFPMPPSQKIDFVFENIIVTETGIGQVAVSFIFAGLEDSLLSITNCKFENFSLTYIIDLIQGGSTRLQIDQTLFMNNDEGAIKLGSRVGARSNTFTVMDSTFIDNSIFGGDGGMSDKC